MIVLGYNGFGRSAEIFGRLFRATGIDRHLLYGHDASAALVVDGKLVAAVEEERLNREKKTSSFPVNAMRWCLESAGISFGDVDIFAFSWQFSQDVVNKMIAEITEDGAATVEQKFARLERLAETHAAIRLSCEGTAGFSRWGNRILGPEPRSGGARCVVSRGR